MMWAIRNVAIQQSMKVEACMNFNDSSVRTTERLVVAAPQSA
jgi:hypothetical protein